MDDSDIIQLFGQRDEQVICLAQQRYGRYCHSIARRIFRNRQDAEECVNDTFLQAWNSISPVRPRILPTFPGVLTETSPSIAFVSGNETVDQVVQYKELVAAINDYLAEQLPQKRKIFVCRYWYFDSVNDIARRCDIMPNRVSATLSRMRAELRERLLERGFTL